MAMLSGRPVVAAAAVGAVELISHGKTGWLTPPANSQKLAEVIQICYCQPDRVAEVVHQASCTALERFKLAAVNLQIYQLLCQIAPV